MKQPANPPAATSSVGRASENAGETRLGTYLDVAKKLGVCERRVPDLVKSGEMIEPIRFGRSVRFDLVALDAWIDAGCPSREHRHSIRERAIRQARVVAGEGSQ